MTTDLISKFGPCGLLCEKCYAFENGPIHYHAKQLLENLGQFDNYAKRFVTLLNEPKFEKYQDFKEMLHLFASNNCKGCRQEQCHLFTNCKVRDCYKTKDIDYCFQCNCFPCNNTGFDDNLQNRWLTINRRIKEIGLENYYNEIKDKPRY